VERGVEAALWIACTAGGFVKAVEVAMQAAGVDVNWAKPGSGSTALYQACDHGHLDVVRVLLAADGIQANQAKNDGTTPLYIACSKGHLDVVRELLGADGIQANQAHNDGRTPLWMACQEGHLDVVRALLGADGIQANQANQNSQTPINIAADKGHVDVVRLLLSVPGIDVTTAAFGKTPLMAAQAQGHGAVVSVLESFSS